MSTFGDNDTLVAPDFGHGDDVVSFGHADPLAGDVQTLNKTAKLAKLDELKKKNAPESSWMSDILGKVGDYGVAPIANLPRTIGELGVGAANLLSFNSPTSPNRPFKTGVPILPEGATKGILDPIQPFIRGMNLPGPKGLTEDIAARVQGAGPAVDEAARSLTTPENLIAMAAGGASKTLAKPVTTLFTGDTVAALPEAVRQAVEVEKDPNVTSEQKGAAWANPALNLTVGALLAKHLGKGDAPLETITAKDRVETDKTFGDLPPNAPVDLPQDQVMTGRQQLPLKAGPDQPQLTRFNTGMPGSEGPIDRSQLSPAELAELDRGPNPVYTPPKEKTMDTPIIGEHPLTKPLSNLSTAIADLQASLNKGQIVPANQAIERPAEGGGPATGGQVSFASPANAESIPSARQSALQLNETITSNPTGPSSQVEGTAPGTLQSSVEKIWTDKGGNVEDQARTGKVDVGGQTTESGQGLYGAGLEAKKQELIAQLKAAPTMAEKQKLWGQIEALKNTKQQEIQTVPIQSELKDKLNRYAASVEAVTSKLEPKSKGIGGGIQDAIEKNKQAGSVSLPTKEEVGKAIDYAKSAPKRILDHIIGHGVDRETGEIVDHILSKQQGWSAPRTISANEEVGNKLVRYASADISADRYAKALASEALGDTHYKDTIFQDKLGKVIVEERLRSLQQYHEGKNESELAASVSHVMTPDEFDSALKDPEIKAAVERHKQIVQPVAEEQHTALGGKLAAKGPETGAFANLLAVTDVDSFETAKQLIYGQGNVNPRAAIKGSVFERRATGQAPKYETNYRIVAERMISGNYKRNALRNWIDAGVEAGLYKYAKAGEGVPEMGGQPMARVPVKIKATPWGSQVVKDLWVRKDLLPEMEQTLKGGGAPMKAGMQLLLNAATTAQIIGPTDMVYHTANMYASIVGSLGAKSGLRDVARKITGVKQLDAMARIGYHMYRAMLDTPEVQKELAEIAKIGALRDQSVHQGFLGQFNTGRLIRLVDKAGRLARNQMFDNLVERGLTKDTDLDRREFINKMGQYNSKLMSHFQATFQQYTSQFVVAGRTFNRNAFQRILMSNEVRAANPQAYWQMKALNMLGVASTLLVVPVVLNSMLNGNPWGRPGTPIGKIDTGKDDDKGRHILIDPSQTELMRRGLRITGIQSAFKGIHEDRPTKETIGRMFEDVFQGQMHPWEGPPVRVGMKYMEKYGETHDAGESLKAAMAAVNPSITTFFGGDEANPDRKGVKGVTESLAGAVGVGKSRLPTHTEKVESTIAKYGMPDNLKGRSDAEKQVKANATPQTREEKARGAEYSIKQEVKRGEGLESAMNPTDLQFVKRRGFDIPGFPDRINFRGQNVVLKDSEVKTLQSYILEEDLKTIQKFKSGRWDSKPPAVQKEIFHDLIVDGRDRARTKLMKQLR